MADELTIQKGAWQRMVDYIADVRTEMKKVTWPNKQEVYSTTVLVIVTTFGFAFFFWVCDSILSRTVTRLLEWFARL